MLKARYLGVVMGLFILAGCSSISLEPAPVEETKESYKYLEQMTEYDRPAATRQLLVMGREAWMEGRTSESLQQLGRALRISPDDALIYYYMATVRREDGDKGEAATLARRGLFFSREPP